MFSLEGRIKKQIVCQLTNHFCLFVLFVLFLFRFCLVCLFLCLFFLNSPTQSSGPYLKSGEPFFSPFCSEVPDLEYVTKWFEKAVRHGVVPETPIAPWQERWCLRKGAFKVGYQISPLRLCGNDATSVFGGHFLAFELVVCYALLLSFWTKWSYYPYEWPST